MIEFSASEDSIPLWIVWLGLLELIWGVSNFIGLRSGFRTLAGRPDPVTALLTVLLVLSSVFQVIYAVHVMGVIGLGLAG